MSGEARMAIENHAHYGAVTTRARAADLDAYERLRQVGVLLGHPALAPLERLAAIRRAVAGDLLPRAAFENFLASRGHGP